MTNSITKADIESLCGRPWAFNQFATALLDARTGSSQNEWVSSRALGSMWHDEATHTIVLVWAWASDDDPDPWERLDSVDLTVLQRWVGRADLRVDLEPTLRIVVPRTPRDPTAWAAKLANRLRSPKLRVVVDGSAELLGWVERCEAAIPLDSFRAGWALHARAYEHSPCERALMAALDRGADASEHWLVVADELQRRGDPTGESLALALATAPDRPSRGRVLSRAYVDHEAARMATAPRHTRMLAFADIHGRSFDVAAFIPAGHELPEPDRYEVQLWAERVGPFFVRLLVRTNYDAWRGVGLPRAVLEAPELRYLSASRLSSIHPDCADLSGRDLSHFDLSALPRIRELRPAVFALEASLRGCDLRGADLSGWVFEGADLRDAFADLDTRFGGASFYQARVPAKLHALLDSWNAGRHRRRWHRPGGMASIPGVKVE